MSDYHPLTYKFCYAGSEEVWEKMQKYYLTGFLGSFIPGVIANIIYVVIKPISQESWIMGSPFQPFANGLVGGFLAGLVGGMIARKFPRYNDSNYVLLTGVLGFIFAIVGNVIFFITLD